MQPIDGMTETLATQPRARGLLVLFVLAFLAICVAATALPHDRYIRYQQLTDSWQPGTWIYERLHYDHTPIDIAIIGASRTEIGISTPQVERILTAKLGRPVHVANLSLPLDGRDLHYELTRELLATHPEVKLILYSMIEHSSRTGHRMFRYVADTGDVVRAPLILNPEYFGNLVFLPFRQVSLFLQTQAPALFGVRRTFDPKLYWGTDHDTTTSHPSMTGKFVDRDSVHPADKLAVQAAGKIAVRTPVFLGQRYRDYEYVIERYYTRRSAELARHHGVEVGFVYLPIYGHHFPISDLAFYRAHGFIMSSDILADDNRNYSDYAHFNQIGTGRMSRWIAKRLAALEQAGQLHFLPPAPSPAPAPDKAS